MLLRVFLGVLHEIFFGLASNDVTTTGAGVDLRAINYLSHFNLHLLNGTEYGRLEQDVTEVKRMLAAFIQQLHGKRPNTDGSELRADG